MRLFTSRAFFLLLAATLPQIAQAKTCDLDIEGNDQMQFSKKELTVGADCTDVKLTLKHTGKQPKAAMGHNWVLTKAADMDSVVTATVTAGPANDYLPKGDKRIIAHTKLIGGGETTTVTFSTSALKAGENYKFFCSFLAHAPTMNGVLALEKGAAKS